MKQFHWREEAVPQLVLGTVQLGMPYGVANTSGRPAAAAARAMIGAAWEGGLDLFDTAQAYGDSEAVLGTSFRELGIATRARVVSKLHPALDPRAPDAVLAAIRRSVAILGVPRLWGLMLHRAEWLADWDQGLGAALVRARAEGLVRHLGVSVYRADELRAGLARPEMEIFQVPCNAWDQRLSAGGALAEARAAGRLCFVRSIYLQGLLLLAPQDAARKVPAAAAAARAWWALAAKRNVAPRELAARFALGLGLPLVVGAETVEQIKANVALLEQPPLPEALAEEIRAAIEPLADDRVLNPAGWGKP